MQPACGLIVTSVIYYLFQGVLTKECAPRTYGDGNVVCVCNNAHCDTLSFKADKELSPGVAITFTTSKRGLRFDKTSHSFQAVSNVTHELIPPARFHVNASQEYQVILGFGATLTDSVGHNIASLKEPTQKHLMRSFFSKDGIGYTQVRVPMGGSDFSSRTYTYDDVHNDRRLRNFTLPKEDLKYKIPILKQIMKMSEREIKLHSSVWTAPAWMKSTGILFKEHSSLKRENYQLWADYFVRFLQAYGKEGIKFWAMSPQNQPTLGTGWSFHPVPSMGWSPKDLRDWIGSYLVPTLGLHDYGYIKILALDDDSTSLTSWLDQLLSDEDVRDYVSGIAVHWYADGGKHFPGVLQRTHNKFPDKFIVYNEASFGDKLHPPSGLGNWQSAEIYANHIFKVLNNWGVGWMEYNMALDISGGPSYLYNNSDASIIVNATASEFYKQPTFYVIGHFSKFIPPDSVRIGLNTTHARELESVAFLTPENNIVIVLNNYGFQDEEVEIVDSVYGIIRFTIPLKSISTVIYSIKEITTTTTTTTTKPTTTTMLSTTTPTTTTSPTTTTTSPTTTTSTTTTRATTKVLSNSTLAPGLKSNNSSSPVPPQRVAVNSSLPVSEKIVQPVQINATEQEYYYDDESTTCHPSSASLPQTGGFAVILLLLYSMLTVM